MTATHPAQSVGARVMFTDGAPQLLPPCTPPPGAVAATASVISPGTELRRMSESVRSLSRPAGYMNVAEHPSSGEIMLAPEPHGAWMRLDHPRALTAPAGTALPTVATARFQLIAALGMSHPAFTAPPSAVVAGSGPVALGCCLELMRRGTENVTLLTARDDVPFARDLGIRLTRSVAEGSAPSVIDATGNIEPTLSAVAPGGTFGLLGTPNPDSLVSTLRLHRHGVAVIGMHELSGYNHTVYQQHYSAVLAWLASTCDSDLPTRWCVRLTTNQVLDHYQRLAAGRAGGAAEPITIVEWS